MCRDLSDQAISIVWRLVLRYSSQIRGEISVDLLAKRKHLNEISWPFCIRLKCDLRNLEADFTSCVNAVIRIDFLCENIIIVLYNKFTEHFSAQILIGHNEAELKIGAFSLGMRLYYLKIYYFSYPKIYKD